MKKKRFDTQAISQRRQPSLKVASERRFLPTSGARDRVIAVGNVKGGVGKTTLAVDLAICEALLGSDVLLIDGDEQGTARAFT